MTNRINLHLLRAVLGQYDKLEERGTKENPYVLGPGTKGHRDMYMLLPNPTELKKMAEDCD